MNNFTRTIKCDVCHKWIDDYAYSQNSNPINNYCGGHTQEEVKNSKPKKTFFEIMYGTKEEREEKRKNFNPVINQEIK
mgnify:CR=1 FL=1